MNRVSFDAFEISFTARLDRVSFAHIFTDKYADFHLDLDVFLEWGYFRFDFRNGLAVFIDGTKDWSRSFDTLG